MAAGAPHGGTNNATDTDLRRFPFRSAVELEVFSNVVSNFKEHKKLLRDDVTALSSTFDAFQVRSFFELLDGDCVTVLRSHLTKRVLVEVHSKVGSEAYYVPPGDSFCQCRAYQNPRSPKYYCKHVLAAHFYLAVTPPEEYKHVAECDMDSLIKNISSGANCYTSGSVYRR